MQNATSYQMFRDAWLNVKKEIEYMVFQEEIIYIRHLCGIDYQYSLAEVELQNKEEPPLYALRDECNMIAAVSAYRHELEQEFGKQIFVHIDQHRTAENADSTRLQSEESALKMQYRILMAKDNRDDEALYQVFRKLIEIRCELADSLGYNSYIDLGYHIQGRQDYGIRTIWKQGRISEVICLHAVCCHMRGFLLSLEIIQAMEWKQDMLSMNLVMDLLSILRRENSRCMNYIILPLP